MRYFADAPLPLDQIKAGLRAEDPAFKIDGGELIRGDQLLGEIEINRPGSDLFDDEIAGTVQRLEHAQGHAVIPRVRATQSVLALQVMDGERTPEITMQLLGPLWSVLQRLANGLWLVDGQGFFENGQLVVQM